MQFLMAVYVGHDRVIMARKLGSNFLPSRRSDCRILRGGRYILGGGVWWRYIMSGGGWWLYFGW